MEIPVLSHLKNYHLPIDSFREMDYHAIENYKLPIELMMENAGFQLARLTALFQPKKGNILIGIGKGNNGGGGLVAARRLAGWGYNVFLDIPESKLNSLAEKQLERALAFGVKTEEPESIDLIIDAYLGFSQRLPLSRKYEESINKMNSINAFKISLDLPTGFNRKTGQSLFQPDVILCLAAMKTELLKVNPAVNIYIADLGIPETEYTRFGIDYPQEFKISGILKHEF